MKNLICMVEVTANAKQWECVSELLDFVRELPADACAACAELLLSMVGFVLSFPSILFANSVCEVFMRLTQTSELPPATIAQAVDPRKLLSSLHVLCAKNRADPNWNDGPGAEFSRMQFPTTESFELAFNDLRTNANNILQWMATTFPEPVMDFMRVAISQLPFPNENDRRGPMGHVTQRSDCFSQWDVVSFFLERVTEAMPKAASFTADAFEALMQKRSGLEDPTIVPAFLNMMACFWSCGISHWTLSLDAIFTCMQLQPPQGAQYRITDDLDLMSARKRAYTLFVRATTTHAEELFPLLSAFVERVQRIVVNGSAMPSEKPFLFEALASLSNGMNDEDQRNFLTMILQAQCTLVLQIGCNITPQALCNIMLARTGDLREQHSQIRDAVGVIAAVLRRCNPSEFTRKLAADLLPAFADIVHAMYALPQLVPPQLVGAFELDRTERDQLAAGGNRRPPDRTTEVHRLRTWLNGLRFALFQGMGTLPKFLPVEQFAAGLVRLLDGCEQFPIHVMRTLCEQCLFPSAEACPPLAESVFPAIAVFLRSQSQKARSPADDAADSRQLFYFTKDAVGLLKRTMLDGRNRTDEAAINLAAESLCGMMAGAYEPRLLATTALGLCEEAPGPVALKLFHDVALMSTSARLQPKEFDSVTFSLCDVYVKRFPFYSEALAQLGIPSDQIDAFHDALMVAPRVDSKRRKFRELIDTLRQGEARR